MSRDLFQLTGKVALITGGSKGLGKAMARGFAEAGADVVIASRHEEELQTGPGGNSARHGPARPLRRRRHGQPGGVARLAASALEHMGRVDILINNAGTNVPQAIDAITDETWDRVMETQPPLRDGPEPRPGAADEERRWGRIIHISSVWRFCPRRNATATRRPRPRCWVSPGPAPSTSGRSASRSTASPPGRS